MTAVSPDDPRIPREVIAALARLLLAYARAQVQKKVRPERRRRLSV